MSKYKIHIDKPLPDSQSIQAHKDFDSLYDMYKVNTRFNFWRNLYRKPTSFAWLVLAISVGFLVWESAKDGGEVAADYFLKAPASGMMPNVDQVFHEGEISGKVAPNITVEAAEGIFADSTGKPIDGDVAVFFRWLPSAESWIKRGLPLEDEGASYASKGVLEIFAIQGDQQLQLLPGKTIGLAIDFDDRKRDFPPMQLDTVNRKWEFVEDTSWINLWDSSALATLGDRPLLDMQSSELIPKASSRPMKAPSKPFGVKISNKNQYPNFARYEKVFWEYLDVPGSANPWTEKLLGPDNGWNDVRVRRTGEKEFTLTFTKILENGNLLRKRVKAIPLYEAGSEAQAEAIYQRKLKTYRDALAAIEQEEAELIAKENASYQQQLQVWEERKRNAVVANGSRCLIRIHKLGMVGFMKKMEGVPTNLKKAGKGQRLWWTDVKGEQLIELSGKNYKGKVPKVDSSMFYQLENGELMKTSSLP